MVDRLNQLVFRARRSSAVFAVLFLDIDGFKDVNDSYGHEFGDLLLRAMAQRLGKSVRQSDTVARLGGDEFVIILDPAQQIRRTRWLSRFCISFRGHTRWRGTESR